MYNTGARLSNTTKAKEIAKKDYEIICKTRGDCVNVARNTGFSIEQCNVVKNYAFRDAHLLEYGYFSFYPDYAMAKSWLRLSSGNTNKVLKHDMLLVPHEFTELMLLLKNPNMSQREAHERANELYNYEVALIQYEASFGQM